MNVKTDAGIDANLLALPFLRKVLRRELGRVRLVLSGLRLFLAG